MGQLTTTNAQISIQDGAGAVSNVNNGNTGFFTPGSLVTFALQSTTGVAKWKLQFVCPSFPSLHLRVIEWYQGQFNGLQVQMPGTPSPVANPFGGIEVVSSIDDGASSIASSVCFLETIGGAPPGVVRYARVATAAALSSYTASNGVLTAAANGTQTVDGVTVAVGDKVLLTAGATASDNGLYIVTTKGLAGAKFVWTRAPEWATGSTIQTGSIVEVGSEGTLYANTQWKVTGSGNPVVDTTDPALYPRAVTQAITLSSGTKTISNVPILSATTVSCNFSRTTATSCSSTVTYQPVGTITPGYVGTVSLVFDATVAAGTINASDGSAGNLTIFNGW